ncbi:hypothetical protein H0H81_002597 [Sphagnurus paluster]|uniref:SnoaL-like domain-containing protein n=1 Tax=Sphagnurus paluster TaxID=117069 RepID=A0A9P7FM24_9AGAR|nr:hypothetical protein H0H81_002597 [Sphagnurus paluster]
MASFSPRLQAAHAWIVGLNEKNIDQLASLSADDFIYTVRPASLGMKPVDKKNFSEVFGSLPIKEFNISLPKTADIVETEDVIQFYVSARILAIDDFADRVKFQTTSNGRTAHGFEFKNDFMFTFTFTNDNLIRSVIEFVDSAMVTAAFSKEAIVAEAQSLGAKI